MIHVYSEFEAHDPPTRLRQTVAKETWTIQPWTEISVKDSDLPRLWKEEGRSYPYLVDLIDFGSNLSEPNDLVIFTNTDTCVVTNCALQVAAALQDSIACYCYRRDFNHDFHEPIPDDVVPRGDNYVGSDLYAFRVSWWLANRKEFPDLLIGHEAWDPIFRHLIDTTNLGRPTILRNLIYHRRHGSRWENPANRYRLRGQQYNLTLAARWMKQHGMNPSTYGIPTKFQ